MGSPARRLRPDPLSKVGPSAMELLQRRVIEILQRRHLCGCHVGMNGNRDLVPDVVLGQKRPLRAPTGRFRPPRVGELNHEKANLIGEQVELVSAKPTARDSQPVDTNLSRQKLRAAVPREPDLRAGRRLQRGAKVSRQLRREEPGISKCVDDGGLGAARALVTARHGDGLRALAAGRGSVSRRCTGCPGRAPEESVCQSVTFGCAGVAESRQNRRNKRNLTRRNP